MVSGIKVEDRLDGDSMYATWKLRMKLTLKDNHLKKFIEKSDQPKGNDELIKWEKDNTKAMKLIVDGVRYHLLPPISESYIAHKILKTLEEMFEINHSYGTQTRL